ncbi:MAG: Holliday junction resolvase RuvX [Chthonomonas sp.]|nr:Holliday junction resolvase RuvX [Chthonomonas sp.]
MIGVDFGAKRIGIAVGEVEPKVATARPPISASGRLATDAEAIVQLMKREEADAIVLGSPVHESDDRMARICKKLSDELVARGATVHMVDESLTSVAAETALRTTNLTAAGRRKLRDGEAACHILERFFEQLP